MRTIVGGAAALVLAVGGVVLPVASLPVPQAHAVVPEFDAVELDGIDAEAVADATALVPAEESADVDAPAAQPEDVPPSDVESVTPEVARAATDEIDAEGTLAALSPLTFTGDFVVAGVTWDDADEDVVEVAVRVHEDGGWSEWSALEVDSLDVDGERGGTQPIVTGGADGVQARVVTRSGDVPTGLRVDVIDPGTSAADALAEPGPASSASAATADVLRPRIVTRAQWGADESRGGAWPEVSADLRAMYVHHTAGSNSYSTKDSAAIVRGIYAYHTGSRDWPDIGYQFLVDKGGTIFQGRRDAIHDLPIGAQAGGYNTQTIGVSAIGNYETAAPSSAMLSSIERLLGWKAYEHGLDPTGRTTLLTGGSTGSNTRAPAGTRVSVNVIQGHRDTNGTACPGRYLYAKLPAIRSEAKRLAHNANSFYGGARPALGTPAKVAVATGQAPAARSGSTTYAWRSVSGAVGYQVLHRVASYSQPMPDARAWNVLKVVKGTSVTVPTSAGYTRLVAVRAIDSSGRLGPVLTHTQSTRPVPASAMRTSGFTAASSSAYYWGRSLRATSTSARLTVSSVRDARQVFVVASTGPTSGRLAVYAGSQRVGIVDLRSTQTVRRQYLTIALPRAYSGTFSFRPLDSGAPVGISAVAFPRTPGRTTAGQAGLLSSPTFRAPTASSAPVRYTSTTNYYWNAVPGATSYDLFVRRASHGGAYAATWTSLGSTTSTKFSLPTTHPGGTWIFGVRARNALGVTKATPAVPMSVPVAFEAMKRSAGWTVHENPAVRRGVYTTATSAGRSLTVTGAKDVSRVQLMVATCGACGRLAVYVDGERVGTVSTSTRTNTLDTILEVRLPRTMSGTVVVRTLDARPTRVVAIATPRR
ncbi:N-acetylmuramoyl-L-alanine amidase [Sediminihabitans luteus]|uniref:N-acetylmuramoyl-L-alanine amidase n=1 Tax=Sediminihabitans luteus TaxID=1138585 RepID=A0A2M9CDR3_9CELL|nr:N-acetylmuramoyl-L-alanine amidase [Sediminihabitans luteus]PJJ69990.1 N-acetylmuramoyl-L-alanine amidase [Sediminihabitans luteus]GII99311.1 hypothetical protein Slu03_16890 [Sediminihabitans luteus]